MADRIDKEKVKNPGPKDQALVYPWKGLLATAGVETQNSGARSQESGECGCRYAPTYLIILSEPKAKTLF